MPIVTYKNQSGVTYAYDQTSVYDPEKKQSRPALFVKVVVSKNRL